MIQSHARAQAPADLESEALVRGRGQYTDDLAPRDALWGAFARAATAHAELLGLDTDAARAAPGVVAVLTAADLAAMGVGPLRIAVPLTSLDGRDKLPSLTTPRPILVSDRIRHAGEALALVVATTRAAAEEAAALIEPDLRDLTPHVGVTVPEGPVADPVWPEAPDNVNFTWSAGDVAGVTAALEAAPQVVTATARNQRLAGSPLEPRAAIAAHDPETGRTTLHIGTQGTAGPRAGTAAALGIDPSDLRVVSKDVGGAFGLKTQSCPEYVALCAASRMLGRPVRWTATRSDSLLTDHGGRGSTVRITGGFDADGRLLALDAQVTGDLGAYAFGPGTRIPSGVIAENINGPYATPLIAVRTTGVHTNTIVTSAYRGAGRPEAAYALERLMDAAAAQLGLDPAELRRRNLIPRAAMPVETAFGYTYDSGDFAAVLDAALAAARRDGFETRRAEARARGRLRGLGLSLFAETAGSIFTEPMDFRVTREGTVELRVSPHASGQRHASTMIGLMSQRLGLPVDRFRYIAGDSDESPVGGAAVGSRVASVTGTAVIEAVDRAIERGRSIVARLDGGQHNDIPFAEGHYTIAATGERIAFLDLPARVAAANAQGAGIDETLDGTHTHTAPGYTFPNGCHVAEVEIDPETGALTIVDYTAVDDCGTVLNPPVVEGQLIGGLAQGIGQAVLEEVVYDAAGQLLSGSFMDYAMPRADDMPRRLAVIDLPDPTPSNPLGVKGVGESGTTGSPAAVVNAALDALRPLGVTDLQTPLTPARLWAAIQAATAG